MKAALQVAYIYMCVYICSNKVYIHILRVGCHTFQGFGTYGHTSQVLQHIADAAEGAILGAS